MTSLMIGPHEGQELELMLTGKKFLAAFSDIEAPGTVTPEAVIPEKRFAPYVENGDILRYEQTIRAVKKDQLLRYVCFCTPGHEWRAQTYLWIKEETLSTHRPHDIHDDIFIGRLLGYREEDIKSYTDAE